MQTTPLPPVRTATPARNDPLWQKAKELEVRFIAEMLRHGGIGPLQGPFGGGSGEEQFASFLREAQAQAMVEAGESGWPRRSSVR